MPVDLGPAPPYGGPDVEAADMDSGGSVDQPGEYVILPEEQDPGSGEIDFTLASFREDGGTYYMTLYPGSVSEVFPEASAALTVHEAYIGGSLMTASPAPELTLPALGCDVYLEIHTDKHGKMKAISGSEYAQVKIIASGGIPATTHFEPPEDDGTAGGQDGMYYLKLFSTQDNGDGAPEVVPGSQHEGSVLWVRGYNCIRNVGGGVGWYKSYVVADDFMELKSAQDAHGIIISGGTNEVTFTFNGHNKSKYPINPGGSASGGAIYMGSTGGTTTSTLVDSDKAQFRGVGRYNYVIKSGTSGAITSPQLQCQIDGRDVMLKGNGVDQAVAWNTCDGSPCVELHFIDGLLKKVVKSSSTVAGSDYYSDSTVGSYEPNMTSCVLGSCDTATT